MTSIVLDFAWQKPSVSMLLAANCAAVGMYVSHDSSKNANLALVELYAAAGIKSFLDSDNGVYLHLRTTLPDCIT
jgi:hypothetical protein